MSGEGLESGVRLGAAKSGARSGGDALVLELLTAIGRDEHVTQRALSKDLGIALGLANACLRRCIRKGLIKVKEAPLRRYAYYLTPHGFAEKSRLTVEYLTSSFDFFRKARQQCGDIFTLCVSRGERQLVLVGAGELAEAAVLSAADTHVRLLAVVDADTKLTRCAGLPVVATLADAASLAQRGGGIDALVITSLRAPQATFERIMWRAGELGIGPGQVYWPALLNISRRPPAFMPADAEAVL